MKPRSNFSRNYQVSAAGQRSTFCRGLGRLDIFPGDDVGARNNLTRFLSLRKPLDYQGVRRAVAGWQPYAGFVYFHFLLARIRETGWLEPKRAENVLTQHNAA